MVRLRVAYTPARVWWRPVSIPKWCDWESTVEGPIGSQKVVSIPKWCDWETIPRVWDNMEGQVSIPKWCDWELNQMRLASFVVEFQFQNGAIESDIRAAYRNRNVCFNSKMVRLREENREGWRRPQRVSIPKWCDWEPAPESGKALSLPFQFQNGAIESEQPPVTSAGRLTFQFQNGAIESRLTVRQPSFYCWFQFQNGAIESCFFFSPPRKSGVSIPKWCDWETPRADVFSRPGSFNSKMVRLRANWRPHCFAAGEFQFQNGAIESRERSNRRASQVSFNSKMVRLRAQVDKDVAGAVYSFNSKMVRLREVDGSTTNELQTLFQFQNGAIESRIARTCLPSLSRFQFQNGAIESLSSIGRPTRSREFQFQNGAIERVC